MVQVKSAEADRFLAVLKEYQASPDVTRERLYLEAIERILANANKVILSENASGVLPFLPLDNMGQGGGGQ